MNKLILMISILVLCIGAKAKEIVLKPEIIATVNHLSKVKFNILHSTGKPHKEYSRCVIKFKLDNVPAKKYAKVRQAFLKVQVKSYKNPERLFTQLHIINHSWTKDNLSWSGIPWPKTKYTSKGYIDLSSSFIPSQEYIGKGRPVICYDVTNILNQWLYQDINNNGFMLRTGPQYLVGNHDKGSWDITFSNPQLTIEFEGTPPLATPKAIAARTIRFFPSASLPPVSSPYHFLWCCWSGEAKHFWDKFKYMNIEGTYQKKELLQRGILSLKGVGGAQFKWLNSVDIIKNSYRNSIGIAIDEWQSGSCFRKGFARSGSSPELQKRLKAGIKAIKQLHKENPSEFICIYWRGEESLKELGKIPDLIVCEAYAYTTVNRRWAFHKFDDFFDKRHVGWAKLDGHYDRTIAMIGELNPSKYYRKYYKDRPMTPEIMERQIKAIRELCPEMAGVGFYARMHNNKDKNEVKELGILAESADKLCYKYFVKPAPKVVITNPGFEQILTSPHVKISVKCKTKDGRRMKSYRYFIDNRLVAESTLSEFIWDCRGVTPGRHIITVHGIDSAYNRAAAQIPVIVNVK